MHGAVRESRDIGEVANFSLYAYTVADPESAGCVILTVVAARNEMDLGHAFHSEIIDELDSDGKHMAFNMIDYLVPYAIADAQNTLMDLVR